MQKLETLNNYNSKSTTKNTKELETINLRNLSYFQRY
ncbi:unnamed protein product [Paramecium sonneborni]|uniref:Uncharacterized protein n=1 Tax=Paramecium sonneborni TaxID=65129 RepID=A0A8S1MMZ0_9CILI|nr:unnamed protein product [Paramecium sonneborni]